MKASRCGFLQCLAFPGMRTTGIGPVARPCLLQGTPLMDKHLSCGVEDKDRKRAMKFRGDKMARLFFFISDNTIIPIHKYEGIIHRTPSFELPARPGFAFFH